MAHIVGVPKREPCLKCSLPVFLAERLIIGKAVYHRTCLKCARCKTQLTPGSFYETEIDGEFCCETCPDEEQTEETFSITDNNTDNYHTSNLNIKLSPNSITETKNNRSSIADRLAFFEMNISCGDGKKLLQKSLSDEEKSKSLKKITEFKPNTALTSFMNSTINDDKKSDDDDDDSADDREYIQDVENSLCIPPMLPKTIPPSVSLQEEYEENLLENSSSSAENESNKMFGNINTGTYDALDSSTILPLNKTQNNNNKYNNNDPNVSVNVTKEDDSNSTVKQKNVHMKKHAELYIQQLPDSEIEISTKNHNSEKPITNDLPELNVIRARLHQFDVINKSGSENNTNLNINTSSSDNDNKILSINSSNEISNIRINLVDNRSDQIVDDSKNIQICKDEEKVPKYTDSKEEQNNFKLINNISNDNTSYLQENVILKNINVDIKSSPEKQVVVNTETIIITNNKPVEASQDNKIDEEHEHINLLEDDKQQMNTISKSNDKIENQESILIIKKEADDENDEISIEINSVENTMQYNQHVEEQSTLNVEYPEELNPFQSDDNDDEDDVQLDMKKKRKSLNPFGSSDEEEDDNEDGKNDLISDKKLKPPRPPPPKISNNPFGSGSENDEETESINITNVSTSIGNNSSKKLPIPTPRTQICSSLKKQTPESTPIKNLNNYDYYGSSASLNAAANNSGHREIFHRHHEVRGSNTSLTSSTNGGSSRKSKKAPAPPPPTTSQLHNITKELFAPDSVNSTKSSPNSSSPVTPQQPRKKRPAPKPPATPKIEIEKIGDEMSINLSESAIPTTTTTVIPSEIPNTTTASFKHSNIPEIGKLSDEEKAANLIAMNFYVPSDNSESETEMNESQTPRRRLISLDKSLLEDTSSTNDVQLKEEHNVIYRRSIRPPLDITTPTKNNGGGDLIVSFPISIESATNNRQLEKMKDNKEAKNRNRQSQCSDDSDPLMNKSTHGKWKRRKGPAPSLPIPPRKVLQMLPLQEIRHELEIIEVQQQGLEKQGVILETMIRERCESKNGKLNEQPINNDVMDLPPVQNSKEVEDLILQLFELVNEKNELFRRQAELMYLRRQHRLEQEQADLEYEIRVLMAQPERNKTDTDKAREEALIARLVEVVQLRNEVIECLEMDRLREAEEDLSIKQRLELHTAKRDEELNKQTPTKLSKKEKKKQKETKKIGKSKKLDADKDADESELNVDNQKDKKKKKKFLF